MNKEKEKITDIYDVEDSIIPYLFALDKVKCTWQNVEKYYVQTEKIDEHLVRFLNDEAHYTLLADAEMKDEEGFDRQKFADELIRSSEITDETLRHLLKNEQFPYNYDISGLSKERLGLLVQMQILPLSASIYNKIRIYPDIASTLIENNFILYSSAVNDFALNKDTTWFLLSSEKLSEAQKDIFVPLIETNWLKEHTALLDELSKYLSNRFVDITYEKLAVLFEMNGDLNQKVSILTQQLSRLENEQVYKLLSLCDNGYEKIVNEETTEVNNNITNQIFVEKLKNDGYIFAYEVNSDKIIIYPVQLHEDTDQ